MNQNVHGYPYAVGDSGWMLDGQLNFRTGVCVAVHGSGTSQNYDFLMADTQQVENFQYHEVYPLLSNVQIKKQQLVTPTPSVSFSPTPTPSRTPHVSPTPSITPSSSHIARSDLLDTGSAIWTATHGSVTIINTNSVKFTSSSQNQSDVVKFTTTVNIDANNVYDLNLDFNQGNCRNFTMAIDSTSDITYYALDNNKTLNAVKYSDSGNIRYYLSAQTNSTITITITLYSDSLYKKPAINGTFYTFNVHLNYLYSTNPPTSNSVTPTPSATPSANPMGLYIAGRFGNTYNTGMVSKLHTANLDRLKNDGTVDSSFVDLSLHNDVNAICKSSDGKIYIGGLFTSVSNTTRNYLARLNSDGTLDTTFTDLALDSPVNGIAVDQSGKIYIGGYFTTVGGHSYTNLARLNSDGTVDTTFTDLALDDQVRNITQFPNGKIYIYGDFTTVGGNTYNWLARLNSDGTVDTTFTDLAADSNVYALQLDTNGKIWIGGDFSTIGGNNYPYLARLNSDGTVDTTFTDLGLDGDVIVINIYSGKIYIGGDFTTVGGDSYSYFARLNSDGTVDTTFTDLALDNDVDVITLFNGHLYIAGTFKSVSGNSYGGLARLNTNGSVDTSLVDLAINSENNISINALFVTP